MAASPRAILFDLDGTLVDSAPGIEAICREAAAEVDPAIALPPLAPLIGPPIAEVLRRAVDPPQATLDAITAAFRRRYDADGWRLSTPYPGAVALVEALAGRGIAPYVVTNKPAGPTAAILAACGFAPHVVEAVSPDSRRPPYASKGEAVAALLARRGLDAATTWLVGDAPADAEAAHANGLAFVAAGYGYGGLDGLAGPVIHEPAGLLALLDPGPA